MATPIIFTTARMNPPHPGHMFLVSELLLDALKQNSKNIYILLSSDTDSEYNPLDFSSNDPYTIDKKRLVVEMVSNVKREMAKENVNISYIECNILVFDKYSAAPLYDLMKRKPYMENVELRMIVGTDRLSFFDSLCNTFLLNNTPVNKVRVKFLKRSNNDGDHVESMSATKIRNLVRDYKKGSGDKKQDIMWKLHKVYEGYLKPENIKLLVKVLSEKLENVQLRRKKPIEPEYLLDGDSPSILTQERGDDIWNEKMKAQIIIKKKEAMNPDPRHDNIIDWLGWAIHSTAKF
jgi:hypothetical protein